MVSHDPQRSMRHRDVPPAAVACLYIDMKTHLPTVDLTDNTQSAGRVLGDEPSPLIDVGALAERLGVEVRFVRRLVDERRIPFYKVGKHVRFDSADVAQWIADRRVAPSGAGRFVREHRSR